jgi:hypothetical protein
MSGSVGLLAAEGAMPDETPPIEVRRAAYQARYSRERRRPRRDAGTNGPPGGRRPSHTAYQPLVDFLAAYPEPAVTLTFAEIEAIIDAALAGAYSVRTMLGPATNHVVARRLRERGWRARIDMHGKVAHFTRDAAETVC